MKRLSGWDAMLLYSETPTVHMHTIKAGIIDVSGFDGTPTIDAFREILRHRLHKLDPLRFLLVDIPFKFHHPMWREHVDVDLDYHVRPLRIAPARAGGASSTRPSARSRAHRWTAASRCG